MRMSDSATDFSYYFSNKYLIVWIGLMAIFEPIFFIGSRSKSISSSSTGQKIKTQEVAMQVVKFNTIGRSQPWRIIMGKGAQWRVQGEEWWKRI